MKDSEKTAVNWSILLCFIAMVFLYHSMNNERQREIKGLESLVEFYRIDNVRLETELYVLKGGF